tara:strand:+ start:27753 stop:28343 length:591 start_codon:yes stop_codon:yes gene_type:complete
MIRKLSLIFGSQSKAQEIVFLLNDLKDVVRHGFYSYELPKIEKFCSDNGLFLEKSQFKVVLAESGFTNKGFRVSLNDARDGMLFVYISKDLEKAHLASYYELMQNDQDLGKILGYPNCCIEFYCNSFSAENSNPMHAPVSLFTNLSMREKDLVLISHFPCKSECLESCGIAKQNIDLLMKLDSVRAKELVEGLRVI